MSLKGTTVTPDKRKGLVYIQQTDDSLIHFCWKDRTSGNVEDVSVWEPEPRPKDSRPGRQDSVVLTGGHHALGTEQLFHTLECVGGMRGSISLVPSSAVFFCLWGFLVSMII